MDLHQIVSTDWVKVLQSIDLNDLWTRSVANFVIDVQRANSRFVVNSTAYYSYEFKIVLTVIFVLFLIDLFSSWVLSRKNKSNILLFITEVLALGKVLLIWYLPTTPMRFGFALVTFASGLGVHSRVCNQVQTNEERPDGSWNQFIFDAFNTQYFSILSRTVKFGEFQFPSLFRTMQCVVQLILIDTCTYLIREWIPNTRNVSTHNQTLAMAIVGGVWALFCMEFLYGTAISQFGLMGIPLPMELRHRHPLLSESLQEFWGIRWNPIIGKLLQDSFYKPLKRLRVSRVGCVIACFSGSALLHALPQYIATRDLSDCYMMFGFFFLQGVCLMAEILVQRAFGFVKKSTKRVKSSTASSHKNSPSVPTDSATAVTKAISTGALPAADSTSTDSSIELLSESDTGSATDDVMESRRAVKRSQPHSSTPYKVAPFQFFAELLTAGCIICTAYAGLEGLYGVETQWSEEQTLGWVRAAVTFGVCATVMYYFVRRHIHRALALRATQLKSDKDSRSQSVHMTSKQFFFSFVGWAWTVVSIMVLLPLFSLPVLHAVEPLYTKSFVIGSIVRTVETIVIPTVLRHI